jgi:hypothetical protein
MGSIAESAASILQAGLSCRAVRYGASADRRRVFSFAVHNDQMGSIIAGS